MQRIGHTSPLNCDFKLAKAHWTATFTPEVPERLVAEFFTHLATTTPVERVFHDVPYFVQNLDAALITPVHRAAVNPHVHHAGAQLGRAVPRR